MIRLGYSTRIARVPSSMTPTRLPIEANSNPFPDNKLGVISAALSHQIILHWSDSTPAWDSKA